ncbi:hypothetical protein BN946_scf184491.g8 [Trametes cinnabarina]|uniref:F-box domain-containing protein n=1 Tax=Pycnoporus cinnabarinus TaxID=5643 RepID=A0A060T0C4_PYCCI|nr:hypothetical protein BN946_scf184491.g8 [Trametes cinnabarina]
MSLAQVPIELLQEILTYALEGNSSPANVLSVNRQFLNLGRPLLHAHLCFRSINQLIRFARGTEALACSPRSLSITLAGGMADFEVFNHLAAALQRCKRSMRARNKQQSQSLEETPSEQTEGPVQVPLDMLSLRLHSHTNNPYLGYIYEALSLANPKTFIWMGPDPEHHFSTAVRRLLRVQARHAHTGWVQQIVPSATYHLIRALSTWTAIEHITLTNLSFPSDELGVNTPFSRDAPLLPALPSLRTLYVGQATLMPPSAVASMLALPEHAALLSVRLVDTYRHSIWGPRIRRRDIEQAAVALAHLSEDARAQLVERVRLVVSCEKKTERIMGGDNGDARGVLD